MDATLPSSAWEVIFFISLLTGSVTLVFSRFTAKAVPCSIAVFAITFFIAWGYLSIQSEKALKNLITENKIRLEKWEMHGCMDPGLVARNVYIAQSHINGHKVAGYGTAFDLFNGSTVTITNRHVVDKGDGVTLTNSSWQSHATYPIGFHASIDLAALDPIQKEWGLRPSTTTVKPGENLLVIGQNKYSRRWFTPSIVQVQSQKWVDWSQVSILAKVFHQLVNLRMSKDLALDDNTKDVNIVRTQGFTAAGNSGSPVVNCAGQVVGVMVSSIPFIWDDTEQASWFIPIDQLATNFEDATQNNSITKI